MASKLERDISAAIEAATRAGAGGPADGFLSALAEKIGAQASVKAVFGEPIERDGLVVVPVAKVRWGFGGGSGGPGPVWPRGEMATGDRSIGDEPPGDPSSSTGSGQGGGGGVTADAIGWLEITEDGAEFKPIVPAMPSPAFMFATTFGAAVLVRALARLLRR